MIDKPDKAGQTGLMNKKYKSYKIPAKILLGMLILSFIYGIVGIVSSSIGKTVVFARSNVQYIKISLQCILGALVLFLPSAMEHKFKITISNGLHILYVLFLYAAIILGQVSGYYQRFYHWDTLLHTLSGAMLSAFGFCIIDIINKSKKINLGLSNWFMSFFSFCFAIMIDTFWEIIEFIMDAFMDLNMQQYILPDGTVLTGHYALVDTMKDLIVDVLGALVVSIIGYILLRRQKNSVVNNIVIEEHLE
ncbi:MAG: hypothetical protein LBG15_08510 [Dysgonamonadaceae bacterium]|jgi:hypothetical protein|nr:hypothetical protein [Dysgonamonadaceae bacterium]